MRTVNFLLRATDLASGIACNQIDFDYCVEIEKIVDLWIDGECFSDKPEVLEAIALLYGKAALHKRAVEIAQTFVRIDEMAAAKAMDELNKSQDIA